MGVLLLCLHTVGETFVTRKVTRSVAQIHLGHMESVSASDVHITQTYTNVVAH